MSRKPENVFIDGVHKHFPSKTEPHREGMANPYRSGTADCWYSGVERDLWIEYKFIVLPKRDSTVIDVASLLSPLQQEWIRGRTHEGRDVWVIVGCKDGGVVFRGFSWDRTLLTGAFRAYLLPRKELAEHIARFVSTP